MENVLTVERRLIADLLPQEGITEDNCRKLVDIIINNYQFTPRQEAENDPSKKQIIPYVTLCRGDEVFYTRRLKKGGESRLHGLISLGIGGHINDISDGNGADVLARGLARELAEEVFIEKYGVLTPRGIINDDTNEVGSVHLGLFYTLEVQGEVFVREKDKLEGFWAKRSALASLREEMETWSQLVVNIIQ